MPLNNQSVIEKIKRKYLETNENGNSVSKSTA